MSTSMTHILNNLSLLIIYSKNTILIIIVDIL
nr:MAG TPA: hypothetical protein [Caudoviricetes sp.]DAH49755.1 MAG TPA: hypothetical protein [Caudoviricetes sp.]DAH76232.1 MAG TPA: hypothetical protein [Caudoviricetes sp.]